MVICTGHTWSHQKESSGGRRGGNATGEVSSVSRRAADGSMAEGSVYYIRMGSGFMNSRCAGRDREEVVG